MLAKNLQNIKCLLRVSGRSFAASATAAPEKELAVDP
jgi:hypothetical protein